MQLNAAGQVELELETPWRDGTTHLVISPLEFMQGLAALVPRPRLHLIRFHGVLAPHAKLRPLVVPQGPEVQEQATEVAVAGGECEVRTVQARPHRIGWARLLKRVFSSEVKHPLVCWIRPDEVHMVVGRGGACGRRPARWATGGVPGSGVSPSVRGKARRVKPEGRNPSRLAARRRPSRWGWSS